MTTIRLLADRASRGQTAVLLNAYMKIAQMEAPESYENWYGPGSHAGEGVEPEALPQ